jgi:hypothetical protein
LGWWGWGAGGGFFFFSSDYSDEEAEACRALSDALSAAALASGAFIAHGADGGCFPHATGSSGGTGGGSSSSSTGGGFGSGGSFGGGAAAVPCPQSLVELVAGLRPCSARVGSLATQLLAALHRQVGHYPLGRDHARRHGDGSVRRAAGHALVSSRVDERAALQAFATRTAAGAAGADAKEEEAEEEEGGVDPGVAAARRQLCRYKGNFIF